MSEAIATFFGDDEFPVTFDAGQKELLWVHDDSGGAPAVYAIRPDGSLASTYTIEGATNTDWEDIAVGPGPERNTSYLFVGDIGQNGGARDAVTVYRVAEPPAPFVASGTLTGYASIWPLAAGYGASRTYPLPSSTITRSPASTGRAPG